MQAVMLSVAFKTALLLAIVAFASRVIAGRSAACRHLLWSAALLASLLLPLGSIVLPQWLSIALPSFGGHAVFAASTVPPPRIPVSWPVLGVLWACGTLLLLARHARAETVLWRWARRARAVSNPRWRATLAGLAGELSIVQSLRVLESAQLSTPCTWGAIRPVLLLPTSGAEWSEDERRQALLHELAHLRRFDYLAGSIARLACALHWYNPLAWLAAGQVRLLQEQACDDAVLRGGGTPSRYARLLVELARATQPGASPPPQYAMNIARRTLLQRRVVAILDTDRPRPPLRIAEALVIGLSACGLMLLLATSTAVRANDPDVQPHTTLSPPEPMPALPVPPISPDPPTVPAVPTIPAIPAIPAVPAVPSIPAIPAVPAVPAIPASPAIEALPAIPAFKPRPHRFDELPPDAAKGA